MSGSTLAVAISFFALGAVLFFSAALALLDPRGVSVRWHLPFQGGLMLWLLGQGVAAATGGLAWDVLADLMGIALPGLFLIFGAVERYRRTRWAPAALVGTLVIASLFELAFRSATLPQLWVRVLVGVLWVWMLLGWMGGALLIWGRPLGRGPDAVYQAERGGSGGVVLAVFLSLLAPVCLILAYFYGALGFRIYAMPLITVGIDILVFYGIVRHQYYDIEVRVWRSGQLAVDAAEAERLAVVGELAAVVAHEVRNPLTGVRSLAQRLADERVDDDRRRRWAGVILEETARMERLVSNLLEVARRAPRSSAGQGLTPLAPLFEDLALLAGARAARAGVTLEVAAGELSAAAPREALAQATLNLLLNAIAYSPAGGRVGLAATASGGATVIQVTDQGPGVPPEDRERIFDPFHSGRPGGTGLGLSVVRRLARELDWTVEVDDAPGGGAEFRLRIPTGGGAGTPDAAPAEAASPRAPEGVGGGVA